MLDVLEPISWVVHPLGGMTLALLASLIFTQRGRRSPQLIFALVMLLALSVLGAGWLVHPAAGMTIAVLASTIFHAWRRERATIIVALGALLVFAFLGAEWAIFPAVGLFMAWLLKVVATGELFRGASVADRPRSAFAGGPAALPEQGSGQPFFMTGLGQSAQGQSKLGLPERVTARVEQRLQKRVDRLQHRAERLGVPLRIQTGAAGPVSLIKAPAPPADTGDLLDLSRDERLPADARARLGALHFRSQEALTYLKDRELDAAGPGFLVRQIAGDYAPEAVRAYLKLPPTLANVTPLQDGKTGRDLLGEQLDLLLAAVSDIMKDAAQAGSQHLLAHQRFLKDRFAKPNDELKL